MLLIGSRPARADIERSPLLAQTTAGRRGNGRIRRTSTRQGSSISSESRPWMMPLVAPSGVRGVGRGPAWRRLRPRDSKVVDAIRMFREFRKYLQQLVTLFDRVLCQAPVIFAIRFIHLSCLASFSANLHPQARAHVLIEMRFNEVVQMRGRKFVRIKCQSVRNLVRPMQPFRLGT